MLDSLEITIKRLSLKVDENYDDTKEHNYL